MNLLSRPVQLQGEEGRLARFPSSTRNPLQASNVLWSRVCAGGRVGRERSPRAIPPPGRASTPEPARCRQKIVRPQDVGQQCLIALWTGSGRPPAGECRSRHLSEIEGILVVNRITGFALRIGQGAPQLLIRILRRPLRRGRPVRALRPVRRLTMSDGKSGTHRRVRERYRRRGKGGRS